MNEYQPKYCFCRARRFLINYRHWNGIEQMNLQKIDEKVDSALDNMKPLQSKVIRMLYGLGDGKFRSPADF